MNSTSISTHVEVEIPDSVVAYDAKLADDMREASEFFIEKLDHEYLQAKSIKPKLSWTIEPNGDQPKVLVEYWDDRKPFDRGLPGIFLARRCPVPQFRDSFSRHELMYQLLHRINQIRLDRHLKQWQAMIDEAEREEEQHGQPVNFN